MRWAASRERWDTGLIPGLAQWVKDPVLMQLRLRWQLQICCGGGGGEEKKKKGKREKKKKKKGGEGKKKKKKKEAAVLKGP